MQFGRLGRHDHADCWGHAGSPNRDKRKARIEVANAAVDRAAAEGRIEHLKVRQATALAWISSYSIERKETLFQDFYKENRLLSDTVRAQIAGGRAQPVDAVTPRQEAAQLAEQQDDLIRQRAQAQAALKRWIGAAANDQPVGRLPEWPVDTSGYSHKLQHHPELAAFAPMTREAEAKVREAESEKQSDWRKKSVPKEMLCQKTSHAGWATKSSSGREHNTPGLNRGTEYNCGYP